MWTPREVSFCIWYDGYMDKKGMGILVLVACVIVAGIIAFVSYDTSLEVTSKVPSVEAPSLDATSNTGTAVKTTETTPAAEVTTKNDTKNMDTKTTASGLKVTVLSAGKGAEAKAGDRVSVNYTGSLTDGKVFDSNVDPKFGHVEPFAFVLGSHQVIAGWEEGVLGMKVGEKRRLVIPASLGYGERGAGAVIPPNATLSFDVEVTGIATGQ